jgi:hypothetical protein
LANPDPAVDQQLFEIAVRGQEAVARRLTTGAQHRAMHAMAVSAGLRQGDATRLGNKRDHWHHDDASESGVNNSDSVPEPEPEAGANPTSSMLARPAVKAHEGSAGEATSRWSSRVFEAVASGERSALADSESPSRWGLNDSELEAGSSSIDGVQAIASASSVLIRLGHPILLFQVEELICTWVSYYVHSVVC